MKTAMEMVQALSDFFDNPEISGSEKTKAWTLLAATRGPDGPDDNTTVNIKHATTSVVRERMFGRYPWLSSMVDIYPDTPESVAIRINLTGPSNVGAHFFQHIMGAFHALGLKWGELNPPRQDKPSNYNAIGRDGRPTKV